MTALADSTDTATDLAKFLTALQQFTPGELSEDEISQDLITERPLAARDRDTRAAIAQVQDAFPASALTELWDAALAVPGWELPPVWFHGDFHAGNLVAVDGRIGAVIDFGALGIGNPACDIAIAFGFMSPRIRSVFCDAMGVDDATWTRARGWAVAGGLNAYTSYGATNPGLAKRTKREVMDALEG